MCLLVPFPASIKKNRKAQGTFCLFYKRHRQTPIHEINSPPHALPIYQHPLPGWCLASMSVFFDCLILRELKIGDFLVKDKQKRFLNNMSATGDGKALAIAAPRFQKLPAGDGTPLSPIGTILSSALCKDSTTNR